MPHVQARPVLTTHEVSPIRAGGVHAQRSEQELLGRVFPWQPGCVRGCLSRGGHAEVAVRIRVSDCTCQWQVAEPGQYLLTAVAKQLQVITRVTVQAAAVSEHVAQRELCGYEVVLKPEAGQEVDEAIIPADEALSYHCGHHHGGDGFRQ